MSSLRNAVIIAALVCGAALAATAATGAGLAPHQSGGYELSYRIEELAADGQYVVTATGTERIVPRPGRKWWSQAAVLKSSDGAPALKVMVRPFNWRGSDRFPVRAETADGKGTLRPTSVAIGAWSYPPDVPALTPPDEFRKRRVALMISKAR